MAIKFIIAGDLHWRGTNPRARRDDYMEALDAKLLEIQQLSLEHKAPVIIPGDIFDSPFASWSVVAQLIHRLREYPEPVLAVPGNHDIHGSNLYSVERTPYGLLEMIDVIRDCGQMFDEEFNWQSSHGYVTVTGHGYDADTDTPEGAEQFMAPEIEWDDKQLAKVHMVHSNLMLDPPGHDMRHTLVSEVKTNADVIISGHYHPGLAPGVGIYRREDGVLFINPGALARTAATASDLSRQVQVALLTVHDDGRCEAELIPLESARPGDEVLSREHLEAAEEREERIQDFLELLAEEGQSRFMEMSEIIEDISERDKLPKEIKAEALKRLSQAKEALGMRE